MFYKDERLALFIDGSNLGLGFLGLEKQLINVWHCSCRGVLSD